MDKRKSKILVVDTNIARAVGTPDSTSDKSKRCRKFLDDVYEICHKVAFSPRLGDEWKNHESHEFKKWLVIMKRRGKVKIRNRTAVFMESVDMDSLTEKEYKNAKKDEMLIDIAFSCDRVVVSMDDKARKIFNKLAKKEKKLKEIIWINPLDGEEAVLKRWLEKGAPPEPARMLGCKQTN